MNFDFRSDVKSDGIQEQSPFCNSSWFNKEKDGSDSMCDKDVALAHPTLARMKKRKDEKKEISTKGAEEEKTAGLYDASMVGPVPRTQVA